jgi:hypothetical protein
VSPTPSKIDADVWKTSGPKILKTKDREIAASASVRETNGLRARSTTTPKMLNVVPAGSLTSGAMELLMQESAKLQRRDDTVMEQMRAVEAKVVDMSRMQDIISENLALQAEVVESVFTTCIEAVDDVVMGCNELKKTAALISSGTWNMFLFIMLCSMILLLFHFITP